MSATVAIYGEQHLNANLSGMRAALRRPFLRKLGFTMIEHFMRNIAAGIDANGNPLKPIQKWTRFAGKGRGKNIEASKFVPLANTGHMRASLGILSVSQQQVEVGFQGEAQDKARRQQLGLPGMMRARVTKAKGFWSGILTAKSDGHTYARYKTNGGQWLTKQVRGGMISIKPAARKFFFLGPKQVAVIENRIRELMVPITARGNA